VSGVSNVENRLRVKQSSLNRNIGIGSTPQTSTTNTSTSATPSGTAARGSAAGS
jgi:hypothetical protein